jgi:hypothetical protein
MHCTIRTFAPYESFRNQQIFAQSVLRKESRKLSYSFKTPPMLPSTSHVGADETRTLQDRDLTLGLSFALCG